MLDFKSKFYKIIPNRLYLCFIFKYLPVLLIITNLFIPERFSGYNIGFIILIRPNVFKEDKCLVYHELIHSYQFYRNPITYCLGRWLKYFRFILPKRVIVWSERKTVDFECEAYANQIKCYKKSKHFTNARRLIEIFSFFVYEKYNIRLLSYNTIRKTMYYYYSKEN